MCHVTHDRCWEAHSCRLYVLLTPSMQWAAELSIRCIIQLVTCHSGPIIQASFSANCLTSLQSKLVCHRAPRCNSPATLRLSPVPQQEKLFAQNWFNRAPLLSLWVRASSLKQQNYIILGHFSLQQLVSTWQVRRESKKIEKNIVVCVV